jgi:hypothetical protein
LSDIKSKVSIIIPHWNNVHVISECLNSISSTDFPNLEIIIVDNASSDNSVEWIKSNYPRVTLIENDKNYGYAGGCNIGADHANGEYLIFLNNDTIQEKNWVSNLVETMNSNSRIAALQPKVLNYYNKKLFDYAGGSGGQMDVYCFPFARGRIFAKQEIDEGQYNNKEKCFWSSGTCFMVRKNLFYKAGGFDDTFFAHMEEIDLCWRLYAMGFEVWVDPQAIVYHKNALTLPMHTHKKHYLNHRNSLLMLFSNYSIKNIFLMGIPRLILEIVACFYSILMLDWRHFTAILRSLFWIISHPNVIMKKRKNFSKTRTIEDKKIMENMMQSSIVIKYYLLKKQTYLDILSK